MNVKFFTLQAISQSLLNETVLADADFQLAQRSAWHQATKESALMSGFSYQELLQVSEFEFAFNVKSYRPSLWQLLVWWYKKNRPRGMLYRLSKNKSGNINLRIVLCRNLQGKYETKTESVPPVITQPENAYVAGILK